MKETEYCDGKWLDIILNSAVRKDLAEEVSFKLRPEGGEGIC